MHVTRLYEHQPTSYRVIWVPQASFNYSPFFRLAKRGEKAEIFPKLVGLVVMRSVESEDMMK